MYGMDQVKVPTIARVENNSTSYVSKMLYLRSEADGIQIKTREANWYYMTASTASTYLCGLLFFPPQTVYS